MQVHAEIVTKTRSIKNRRADDTGKLSVELFKIGPKNYTILEIYKWPPSSRGILITMDNAHIQGRRDQCNNYCYSCFV